MFRYPDSCQKVVELWIKAKPGRLTKGQRVGDRNYFCRNEKLIKIPPMSHGNSLLTCISIICVTVSAAGLC